MPTFDPIFARDPGNPDMIASNATITLFDPVDTATKTPLALTRADGTPLPNPYTVNRQGQGPAFVHATLYRVAWEGGGFTGFFTAIEKMHEDTLAARAAADVSAAAASTAATEAAAAAQADLEARIAAGNFKGEPGDQGLPGVNAVPADEAVGTYATTPGTKTHDALTATIASESAAKWKPDTAYTVGQRVIAPSGFLVTAIGAVAAGPTFDPLKWRYNIMPDLVQDFGAVGDGIADDTAAVLKAVQYALAAQDPANFEKPPYTSNNGTVFAPIGTYSVNEIPIAGTIKILGMGGGTYANSTFLQRTEGQAIFRLKADTDLMSNSTVFENISFKSQSATSNANAAQVITDPGIATNSVYFRKCWFKSPERYAIWLSQGNDIQIDGCTFDVSAFHSIKLGDTTTTLNDCTITNCTFYDIALNHIELVNVRGVKITNNRAYTFNAPHPGSIFINGEGAADIDGLKVGVNEVRELNGFVKLPTNAQTVSIADNVLLNVSNYLLWVTGTGVLYNMGFSDNTAISLGAFEIGAAIHAPTAGMQVSTISGNSVIAGAVTPLFMNLPDARVTGNKFEGNPTLRFTAQHNLVNAHANGLPLLYFGKAGAPTTTEVPSGAMRVVSDTSDGSMRLWVNANGVLKSTLLS